MATPSSRRTRPGMTAFPPHQAASEPRQQLVDHETKNANHHDARHHQLHIELLLTENNQRPQPRIDAGHFAGEYSHPRPEEAHAHRRHQSWRRGRHDHAPPVTCSLGAEQPSDLAILIRHIVECGNSRHRRRSDDVPDEYRKVPRLLGAKGTRYWWRVIEIGR